MITLIGHGFIGTRLAQTLENFEWISHNDIPSKNTKFIVNATGYIGSPNVDAGEAHRQMNIEANVRYPMSLEHKFKVPIIHITTGCLYNGYPEGGFKEDDPPNLNFDNGSFYSGCKSLLQEMMTPYLDKSYMFRIRLPFDHTHDKKNLLFKYEMYDKLYDTENSLTYVKDLCNIVNMFIKERPEGGIYNITNPGATTTKRVADKMGLTKEWFTAEEFKKACPTPRSNCFLNTKKIENLWKFPDVDEAIEEAIYLYK
jgi:UDP-glucose 4,6-dehydratase